MIRVHILKVLTSLQAKVKATQRLFCLVQLVALVETTWNYTATFLNGTWQKLYLNVFACLKD